jgi:hypothetical protein
MYINKFSSGTILALLALSGMLFLVPLAVPVHASNASPPTLSLSVAPIAGATPGVVETLTVTNPSTNQYAITALVLTAPVSPTGFSVTACGAGTHYLMAVVPTSTSCSWTVGSGSAIPPGSSDTMSFTITTPASGSNVYPYTASFTSTAQDASGSAYYPGSSVSVQVLDPSTTLATDGVTVTPGGSNTVSTYTAGTAPYGMSVTATCTASANCPGGVEGGVTINWSEAGYAAGATYTLTPKSGTTTNAGTQSTVFQPSNVVASGSATITATIGVGGAFPGASAGAIATAPATPSTVSFGLGALPTPPAFPSTEYVNAQYTTTNPTSGTSHFTGAELSATNGASVAVSDAFGNPETYGSVSLPLVGLTITVQGASGSYFDKAPNAVNSYTLPAPGSNTQYDAINDNYVQSGTYGTVGVITATITGTFNGNAFSVSGSSGSIVTSLYAGTTFQWQTTDHVQIVASPASTPAGKSATFEFAVIPPAAGAQSGVPVTLGICPNHTCAGTTKGYTGTLNGGSVTTQTTNSTGLVSATLTVDTTNLAAAALNYSVPAPVNPAPSTAKMTGNTGAIVWATTTGTATKFEVSVGVGQTETPSPISFATPGETVYVNVITTDNYGNLVTNAQSNQIQINLIASPNTVTASSIYIPQGCAMTNATTAANTHGYQCTGTLNSFGTVAWTLPSTVGSVATISASGVLGGVSAPSATTSITVVSASPTLSVTAPTPTNGYLYTNNVNVQFKGWANVSKGYNSVPAQSPNEVLMSTLGLKIGSNHWVQNSITGVVNSQWSVIATLPQGLSTVNFNATDTKGNTIVLGTPYNVLVDVTTPTITFVTPANAVVNGTNPLTATIVSAEGDLNATSVGVSYNGTALAHSAISVTGTNNPGSSVSYTVTATLPVGKWNVVVSATTLAGNTGTSSTETVTEIVASNGSYTIVGTPTQTTFAGNPDTVTGVYKNNLAASQTITVIAAVYNSANQQIGFSTATITISAGGSATFYLGFVGLTPGQHYTVKFTAYSSTGVAGSVPTTVSITA